MFKVPEKYNTKGLNDLSQVWSSIVSRVNDADDARIAELAEEILIKLNAPVNSDNMIIVIAKLKEMTKTNHKDEPKNAG